MCSSPNGAKYPRTTRRVCRPVGASTLAPVSRSQGVALGYRMAPLRGWVADGRAAAPCNARPAVYDDAGLMPRSPDTGAIPMRHATRTAPLALTALLLAWAA